jgi:Arc/MetJ-type ribon-helix-helix transcriptional regulator
VREKPTTRVQLELPASSMERLKALRTKTEAASYAEVIRNALRLYEALIGEVEAGNQVFVKDARGHETAYRAIF